MLNPTPLADNPQSRFLAAMSHELRTPLNAIIGFSEAILADITGETCPPRCREYIAHIHESGQNLLAMIENLLAKADSDRG